MDVYVNGEIVKRVSFEHVPKQNYGNVNVCHNKGFSGNLSDLRYFSRALNVFRITNIVNKGLICHQVIVTIAHMIILLIFGIHKIIIIKHYI